ncbi:MAG: cytochrome C [Candidatus Hydrogenedentes bacterium]|nr:cytochrome C [Candidatus Hydrogenedentota bacterium]
MTHTKHLWRVAILLIVAGVAGIVGRHFLIPPTFGATGGFYRAGSLEEHMSRPVVHGTRASCIACHDEVAQAAVAGKHAGVSCETCHAPESLHAKDGAKTADMPSTMTGAQCAICHAKLRARPEKQKQIDFTEHLITLGIASPGDQIPEDVCYTCHDPHSPAIEGSTDEQTPAPTEPAVSGGTETTAGPAQVPTPSQ